MKARRIFYKRSGEVISRKYVRESKTRFASRYRTGEGIAGNKITLNPRLAERIEKMTEEEYCREMGGFTYK